jgi:transposase
MAMGKSKPKQETFLVASSVVALGSGHPFYARLNDILRAAGFDAYVEKLCEKYYAPKMGRPSLPPGLYFRALLVGYYEGLDSERGIAWRVADSLAIRDFLGLSLDERAPDHSTLSKTRRLIELDTHLAVSTWVQQQLVKAGLFKGKTLGIDGTLLEANAAMRSIVRRDTGEGYDAYITGLMQAEVTENPTREERARFDSKRKKRTSNDDWKHPHDPDAKVGRMKDGRTHMAHKVEHAVDMDSGAIAAVVLHPAHAGDTSTLAETLTMATTQVQAAQADTPGPTPVPEVVADKGYHSNQTMIDLRAGGHRSYVSEPKRGRRNWSENAEAKIAVLANHRRIRGEHGQSLRRKRGERVERSFAHMYDTGGMRRTHLRRHDNILKRLLLQASGFNLGLMMRQLFGIGKPRALQGLSSAFSTLLSIFWRSKCIQVGRHAVHAMIAAMSFCFELLATRHVRAFRQAALSTGC